MFALLGIPNPWGLVEDLFGGAISGVAESAVGALADAVADAVGTRSRRSGRSGCGSTRRP